MEIRGCEVEERLKRSYSGLPRDDEEKKQQKTGPSQPRLPRAGQVFSAEPWPSPHRHLGESGWRRLRSDHYSVPCVSSMWTYWRCDGKACAKENGRVRWVGHPSWCMPNFNRAVPTCGPRGNLLAKVKCCSVLRGLVLSIVSRQTT